MVAEACQDSGVVYSGNTYNGYGDIYVAEVECVGDSSALTNVTDPWSGVHNSEIFLEDETKTYTSGSEVYTVKCTEVFCGVETNWASFTECWWTDDENRYVKTSGSNSALGNNWANAWLTMGYGFQNIPSGKDLYVEEGLYGSETLSNLDPPQTMKMYIQPFGHTEAACKVVVFNHVIKTIGSTDNPSGGTTTDTTWIDTNMTAGADGKFRYADLQLDGTSSGNYIKIKVFEDDGTNYIYKGGTGYILISTHSTLFENEAINLDIEAGDIIGVHSNKNNTSKIATTSASSGSRYFISGDIVSNTLKSAWTASGATDQLCLKLKGY